MSLEQHVHSERVTCTHTLDDIDHCVDVAEDLGRAHVTGRLAGLALGVSVEQAPGADLESFDA